MRTQVTSTINRTIAKKVTVGRRAVVIMTDSERIDMPIPDSIAEEFELPAQGTVLTNVMVTTSGGDDVLYGMYPASGTHIVAFERFAARNGEEPTPKHVDAQPPKGKRTWWTKEKYIFTALLRVVAGDFTGMLIPWTLDYCFERDHDGTAFVKGSRGSMERLGKFLTLAGMDVANETLRYTDNLLPDLEMLLSQNDAIFQVQMKEGWVDDASELPAGLDVSKLSRGKSNIVEDDDEEAEEAAPVKATASSDPDEDDWDDEEEVAQPPARRKKVF